mgnify:FL=1
MAISYTWDVSNVDTYPSHTDSSSNTESDVIYNVHWRLKGSDDANNDADGNPQTGEVYGSQSLDVSDLSSFTAFASVSLSNVQGWVETAMGSDEVTALKAGIDAQIAEKVTPTSVNKTIS